VVAVTVCLAGLFLTFSKSAWLATSIATALMIVLAARSWRSRAAILLTAGLLSTAIVPWPALVLQFTPSLNTAYRTVMVRIVGESRFDSWNPATVAGRGSVMFRVGAAEAGLHMAVDHPILGVGLNQYHRYYMDGYGVPPTDQRIDHAHSIWPELAAEVGFPAMMLVVLIYAAALLALWRVYRDPPDSATRLIAATLMAAIVSWLIVATAFGSDIYRPARNMSSEIVMMAVLVAAAFALARYSRAAMVRLRATQG
jgi:O-antigen ligase